jgi:general secretion pathway protein K
VTVDNGAARCHPIDLMRPVAGQDGEHGFALVLVLVVIVVLSVMTEAMTRWVSGALEHAFANRREVDARREFAEAAAVSLYLLGTRPLSFRGIESSATALLPTPGMPAMIAGFDPAKDYVRLDDYPYRLGDDTVVRLQDARGLINLNLASANDLFAVLGLFGAAAEDRGPLIAKLQDYIDVDSLTRLNGAEAPQYADAGREPPANAPLRTPWEVRRILDWDKVDRIAREDSGWALLTSTGAFAGFNLNTAPPALLSLMPWMTSDGVDNVVRWRREQPITSPSQFGILAAIPMPVGPSRFLYFPADHLAITISTKGAPLERHIALHLTPQSPDRPWTIDYDVEMPLTAHDGGETKPDALPIPPILSPIP